MFGIHIDLFPVLIAQRGLQAIILVIPIPFASILIPIQIAVCGVQFMGIVFRFIVVSLVFVVIIPFEGVLVRQCVFLTQPAFYLKLPVP